MRIDKHAERVAKLCALSILHFLRIAASPRRIILSDSIGVLGALLPFAVLFSAFLIFKRDALTASLSAWAVEFVLVLAFYRMPISGKFWRHRFGAT